MTNSTTKYFYIVTVADTLLTVSGGTDYTVANAAISAIYYSKVTTPLSFPGWFNYTPTWANLTVGSATQASKFTMNGKTVLFRIHIVLSSSTMGSSPTFTLPVASIALPTGSAGVEDIGEGTLSDSGSAQYTGKAKWLTTTTAGVYTSDDAAASVRNDFALSSTVPVTWANSDAIILRGFYEAA
jgi:hypothetical protein